MAYYQTLRFIVDLLSKKILVHPSQLIFKTWNLYLSSRLDKPFAFYEIWIFAKRVSNEVSKLFLLQIKLIWNLLKLCETDLRCKNSSCSMPGWNEEWKDYLYIQHQCEIWSSELKTTIFMCIMKKQWLWYKFYFYA